MASSDGNDDFKMKITVVTESLLQASLMLMEKICEKSNYKNIQGEKRLVIVFELWGQF